MSDHSLIQVADDNDQMIGLKIKSTVGPEEIYRVSAVWVTNSKGGCFLLKDYLVR